MQPYYGKGPLPDPQQDMPSIETAELRLKFKDGREVVWRLNDPAAARLQFDYDAMLVDSRFGSYPIRSAQEDWRPYAYQFSFTAAYGFNMTPGTVTVEEVKADEADKRS